MYNEEAYEKYWLLLDSKGLTSARFKEKEYRYTIIRLTIHGGILTV